MMEFEKLTPEEFYSHASPVDVLANEIDDLKNEIDDLKNEAERTPSNEDSSYRTPGNEASLSLQSDLEEPMPLQRELADAPLYPVDALGGVLGPAAQKIAEVAQAPLAICGQSILAAATLAVQGHANVSIDGRESPISEFFLTIGQSGERKSAVDTIALTPHRKFQESLREQYEQDIKRYNHESEAYKKSKDECLKKGKDFQGKMDVLSQLGDEPFRPLSPLFIVEEPTYEGLIKLLSIGQASQGLFSDEGGRFIGGHGMNQDNALKTAAGLCGLWDGKPITRVRAGEDSSLLVGRRITFHLMAQPGVAQILLSNQSLLDQGLLSRCLAVYPQSTVGSRLYREENLLETPEVLRYFERITAMLNDPPPLSSNKRNELTPPSLEFSQDSKALWVSFHNDVERKMSDNGILAPIKSLANKAPEHVARLAVVLALIDNDEISRISRISKGIPLESTKNAILLVDHYLNEALRLFESEGIDPDLSLANRTLGWLKENKKSDITLVELYQHGPNKIRSAPRARSIMSILVNHGWAIPLDDGTEYNGKLRKEAWRVRI